MDASARVPSQLGKRGRAIDAKRDSSPSHGPRRRCRSARYPMDGGLILVSVPALVVGGECGTAPRSRSASRTASGIEHQQHAGLGR